MEFIQTDDLEVVASVGPIDPLHAAPLHLRRERQKLIFGSMLPEVETLADDTFTHDELDADAD